jgi:hypothetical protein
VPVLDPDAPAPARLGQLALLVARLQDRHRSVCHRCGALAASDTGRVGPGGVALDYRCPSCPAAWSERLGPAQIVGALA